MAADYTDCYPDNLSDLDSRGHIAFSNAFTPINSGTVKRPFPAYVYNRTVIISGFKTYHPPFFYRAVSQGFSLKNCMSLSKPARVLEQALELSGSR
jgi:hypothetical protein